MLPSKKKARTSASASSSSSSASSSSSSSSSSSGVAVAAAATAAATVPAAPDWFEPVPVDIVRSIICYLGYDHLFGCAPEPFYRGCVVRRVVHLRTVCKFFLKALGKKQQYKLLELLGVVDIAAAMGRVAHLAAPSEDYPDVYAAVRAVRAFKEVRVLGERPLEIQPLAGKHVIGHDFTDRYGFTRQGLKQAGPAFSGVSICGAGIKETRLSGGRLYVENIGGGAPTSAAGPRSPLRA